MSILLRRRGLLIQQKKLLLPSEYQQVEYIENKDEAWIDTGFIANQDTRIVVDYQIVEQLSSFIFGARVNVASRAFALNIDGNPITLLSSYGSSGNVSLGVGLDTNRHIVDKNKNVIYFDGQERKRFSSTSFTTPFTIALFACNQGQEGSETFGYLPGKIKLFSCKIYDNGVPIRDYIPCYQKNDGKIGLYDMVNEIFYINSGTGTFEKGGDV